MTFIARPAAVLLACSLLLAGCTSEVDLADVEARLVELQQEETPDLEVDGAQCPEDVDLEEGVTFECDVTIEGVPAPYSVTMTKDDPEAEVGSFHFEPAQPIIDVTLVVEFIRAQLNTQSAGAEVDCGEEKVIVTEVGGTFECTVSDERGSETVEMVAKDKEGTVGFK